MKVEAEVGIERIVNSNGEGRNCVKLHIKNEIHPLRLII